MEVMSRKEFVSEVAEKTGRPKKEIDRILDAVLETIKEKVLEGHTIKLVGFGKFELKSYPPRTARKPNTGEQVQVPARSKVVFTPGKELRKREA